MSSTFVDGQSEIVVGISAEPMEAPVNSSVTLKCHAYNVGAFTEASIANVTWTQEDNVIAVTQDNTINVTSDTPGVVNFTCTAVDDSGNNGTASGYVEFFYDLIEGKVTIIRFTQYASVLFVEEYHCSNKYTF